MSHVFCTPQADDLSKISNIAQEDSIKKSDMILMRFTPALLSGAPEILVEAPITHPFLVKDKGKIIEAYDFTEKMAFTIFCRLVFPKPNFNRRTLRHSLSRTFRRRCLPPT